MKNCILQLVFLLSSFSYAIPNSYAGKQRMVILPSSMNYDGGGNLKTLCIDYGVPGPQTGDIYQHVLNYSDADATWIKEIGHKYHIEGGFGHHSMQLLNNGNENILPLNIQPVIVGYEKASVDARYFSLFPKL